jgi:group I intron endonuclease
MCKNNGTIFYLYQYTNLVNGKRYIGTTNRLEDRFREHARGRSGARVFNNAVKKYGIENFSRSILAVFDDVNAACYHEQAAILGLRTLSPDGYNLRAGAPFTKYSGLQTEHTKAVISQTSRERWQNPEYRKSTSVAISASLTGVPLSPDRVARMRGRKFSDEHRRKLSEAKRGKSQPPEVRANHFKPGFVPANKGKPMSVEERKALSARMKAYYKTPEGRDCAKRIAAAKRGRTPWNKGKRREGVS